MKGVEEVGRKESGEGVVEKSAGGVGGREWRSSGRKIVEEER